ARRRLIPRGSRPAPSPHYPARWRAVLRYARRARVVGRPMTTVLVVDDEHNLVELVQGYLEHEGYRVLTAGDGPTALELVRSEQPDLVILDVMLPGLDGVEVCRRLRQFSDAYVLMLTARAEEI